MKRAIFLLLVLLILCGSLSACSYEPSEDSSPAYSFCDDLGNGISISYSPKRVAVLFSSLADIWCLAGGEVAITVGESVERGFASGSAVLVDSGAGKTVNTEALLAAEPDFVICSADIEAQVKAAELLNRVGIPSACFCVDSFEDYLRVLKVCTDITGDRESYRINGEELALRVEELLSSVSHKNGGDILFVRSGSGASSAKAKTADQHFAAAMLSDIGTRNIAEDAPILLDGLSVEAVLASDPDIIFVSTMGNEDAAIAHMNSVLSSPAWRELTAVKNGRVYYLPRELFQYKPNGKWDIAYEYLIGIVYG